VTVLPHAGLSAASTEVPDGLRRVALLSVHTSPLDQPGAGDGGGLNVYVREVATRLAARGVDVDVFTRAVDPDAPEVVVLRGDGPGIARVHHIEAGPVAPLAKEEQANHLCAFMLALQRHPTAGSHDLVHAHYWLSGWVGQRVAERWQVPLIQTFHTLGVLKNQTLAPGDVPEPALRLIAEERISRAADRVLVLTCGEARLLHRTYRVSGSELTVVPAGVDLERFAPSRAPRRPGPPRLLFVGRLQPLKGPDVAVRTLAEVRRRLPDATLRIVGGASGGSSATTSTEGLRELARQLGVEEAVELEPALDQATLAERYRDADAVLVPSRSETFGLVALEAQACGTPVVAADVPGLEAVVGAGGLLVPGHDPEDHAEAALTYLVDPEAAAQAGAAGVATAARASWDRTVDRLLDVYGELTEVRASVAV
jgi:D-inositol-3-phosphate glycosyltransferase